MFTFSAQMQKLFQWLLIVNLLGTSLGILISPSSFAEETKYRRVLDARTNQYYYVPEKSVKDKAKSLVRNPIVKQSAVGAAVGVAAGALSGGSVAKGAGVGALVGAGTGLIDSSKALDGKPLVKDVLKGAAIGTGASAVMDKSGVKGAATGAAAGAGLYFLKNYLNKPATTNQN